MSFFNPLLSRRTGRNNVIDTEKPDDWFEDDEIALRLYKNIRAYEAAIYGYRGFWKSPGGSNPATGEFTFPKLAVVGGSIRGVVGKGIGNVEIAYYDSRDDDDGDDPAIRNGESRFLIGYQQEVGHELTAAFQYYVEHMLDHDNYRRALPPGVPKADENRHVVTLRLTKLYHNQNLELSLISLYSPSDGDAHVRPKLQYKVSDRWSVEIGSNIFFGIDDHTFYGNFKDNTNVYSGIRNNFLEWYSSDVKENYWIRHHASTTRGYSVYLHFLSYGDRPDHSLEPVSVNACNRCSWSWIVEFK